MRAGRGGLTVPRGSPGRTRGGCGQGRGPLAHEGLPGPGAGLLPLSSACVSRLTPASCPWSGDGEGEGRGGRAGQACDLRPSHKHRHPVGRSLVGGLFSPSADNDSKNSEGHGQEAQVTARETQIGAAARAEPLPRELRNAALLCPRWSKLPDFVLEASGQKAAPGPGPPLPWNHSRRSPVARPHTFRGGPLWGVGSGPHGLRTGCESRSHGMVVVPPELGRPFSLCLAMCHVPSPLRTTAG